MSSDDSSARSAAPIVLRIKLRYDDVDVMVQRFATNVGKSGLFLPTKSIQPIGAEIKFELRLADDTPALVGLGRVKLAKPQDPNNPKATFGMTIELMRVTPQSRALILRMLEQRRALGLPELGLPTPDDIDAARAEVVIAAGRDPASGPVRGAAVVPPAAPAAAPPIAAIEAHPGEALMTAPRRTTGPLTIAKVHAVTPLAPEPPRRKRVAISDIIESASGPVASVSVAVPGLDDDVDVAAALARARTLASGTVEAELEALCEQAAAPLEISVEAASAELARQLGGSAVRRDRSARWAPPPATKLPTPADAEPARGPEAEAGAEPAPPPVQLPSGASPDLQAATEDADAGDAPDPAHAQAPPSTIASDEPGSPGVAPSRDGAEQLAPAALSLARTTAEHDVEPEQADVIHHLNELDLEDVERTELGDIPVPPAFDLQGFAGEPAVVDQARLAERLEAQLAEAEVEADAENLELARALGLAAHGDPVAAYEHRAELEARSDSAVDVDLDEIDDFEILAETDADDANLLAVPGEQDASDSGDAIAQQPTGVRRPSGLDFASRLDLGDDSDLYYAPSGEFVARDAIDRLHEEFADRHAHFDSAGHALAAFDTDDEPGGAVVQPIYEPEPSNSFTLAGAPAEAIDLEIPAAAPPPPSEPRPPPRPQRAPIRKQPSTLRNSPFLPSLLDSPVEDHELESALEALDVDLDDLAIPHAATELQRDFDPSKPRSSATIRPPSQSRGPQPQPQGRASQSQGRTSVPMPARAGRQSDVVPAAPATGRVGAPRLTTEDGVLIDFEDDD